MLDFSKPVTYGAQTEEDWHYEHKAKQPRALMDSYVVIDRVFEEFEKKTGRRYNRLESYMMEDAEVAILALGTTVETSILAAKQLREEEGIKAGVVAPRTFRPFPLNELREVLAGVKSVAALDRSCPMGAMGALYNETCGALATIPAEQRPLVTNFIYGLGGRDFSVEEAKRILREQKGHADVGHITTPIQQFSGLRGPRLGFYESKRS